LIFHKTAKNKFADIWSALRLEAKLSPADRRRPRAFGQFFA
jgi:hypothetical protein